MNYFILVMLLLVFSTAILVILDVFVIVVFKTRPKIVVETSDGGFGGSVG
jgi:hypothetical protein